MAKDFWGARQKHKKRWRGEALNAGESGGQNGPGMGQ